MNIASTRPSYQSPLRLFPHIRLRTGVFYALIIILAMAAFEAFNYSTTAFALKDLLGGLTFAGIQWSTLLAIAFCGIDFAGIASLISQPHQRDNKDAWYLFGAWLIAGSANAALTWWGVSMAIANHPLGSAIVVNTNTLTGIVPIFVAVMVWVIRVLIISSLSTALERMTGSHRIPAGSAHRPLPQVRASYSSGHPVMQAGANRTSGPTRSPISARKPASSVASQAKVEPTYHPVSSGTFDSTTQDRAVRRL